MDLVTKLQLVENNYAHNRRALCEGSFNFYEEYPENSADYSACKMTAMKEARGSNFTKNDIPSRSAMSVENYILERISEGYKRNENIPKNILRSRIINYDSDLEELTLDVNATMRYSNISSSSPAFQQVKNHLQVEKMYNTEFFEDLDCKINKPIFLSD